MTLKNILEDLNEDSDFLKKKLKELKQKYPNIPYVISSFGEIISYKNGKEHSYEDQPTSIEYFENEKIYRNIWYKNGNIHRDGDKPAFIKYYYEDGKIKEKIWYKNNKKHRDNDKPAYIHFKNGKIKIKEYFKNGERHRDNDKPAIIYYDKNGKIRKVEYYKNGKQYNKKLEELKKKFPNIPYEFSGSDNYIMSKKNGKYHSYEEQPSIILYYEDGKIKGKDLYKNGKLHRDNNKPAVIKYNEDGKIEKVEYWKNGKRYHPLSNIDDKSSSQTRRDLDYNR